MSICWVALGVVKLMSVNKLIFETENIDSFLSFFKKAASPIRLGRWKHEQGKEIIDLKVDFANHDCCGGPVCRNHIPSKKQCNTNLITPSVHKTSRRNLRAERQSTR